VRNYRIHYIVVWLLSIAVSFARRFGKLARSSLDISKDFEPTDGAIHGMNGPSFLHHGILSTAFSACALLATFARADTTTAAAPSLAGTWTLVAADVLHPDGTRARDYGAAPKGLLLIDPQGHYSLQIFKSERPQFASGDKSTGTPAEYKDAVMGSSTHFGTISVDPVDGTLTFHVQNASFPNWEGQLQKRSYELKDGELSYRVTARPNGDVPISVWRKID
jgi:hypothetical protein